MEIPEPNWLVGALIGAILGYLVPHIVGVLFYFYKIQKKHHLERVWFGYYYIFENQEGHLKGEKLEIKKGIQFNESKVYLTVAGESFDSQPKKYSGRVWEEGDWLIINMQPATHNESIFMRFKNPLPSKIKYGLWSAIDEDGKAAVGPMILSDTPLSDNDAKKQLNDKLNHFIFDQSYKILHVSY